MLPTTITSKWRQDWIRDIIYLSIILFIFYTIWLGSYPLFTPDEGRYSEVAREMVASGDYITPRVDGIAFLDKPILYYWLQATAIKLFGVKEWALRLFPALLGVLGCIATYVCGRRLFDRRTGLISAIILATTPLYFASAHYANLDLEVAVFISCTLFCFITGVQSKDRSRPYFLFAAYIFAALAALTKGLIGIAFPSMIAGSWIILLWRWDILKKIHLIAGLALFILITLPWYILVQKANPDFLNYFFVTQQVTRFLSAGVFNNSTPFWFYLPIVLVGFFPWTIFLVQALTNTIRHVWKARSTHSTELFLLLWLSIIFIFFSIPRSKTIGYILPVFPVLALLVGNYLSKLWERAQQNSIRLSILNFVVIGVILATILLTLPHYHWIDFASGFKRYLTVISITLIASMIAALSLIKKETVLPLFITCVTYSTLFLLTLTLGAKHLNQNTAKPLVAHLKTIIKPEDEVIAYFKYYQDVPLYLGKRVTIVTNWEAKDIASRDNWVRELWYGRSAQNTEDWLIDEEKFWERWESDKRVFVFVNANYLDQFKEQADSYFNLGKYNDIILLSNKPTIINEKKHS